MSSIFPVSIVDFLAEIYLNRNNHIITIITKYYPWLRSNFWNVPKNIQGNMPKRNITGIFEE